MRIVPHHIIDSDATPHKSIKAIPISLNSSPPQLNHTTHQQSILHNDTISTQSDHVIPIVPTNTTDDDEEDGQNKQQETPKSNPRRSTRIRKKPEYLEYPSQGSKYIYPAKVLMLHHPRIMKIVHATTKLPTPPHIGAASRRPERSD